jgi:hypothetical protein
VDPDYSSAKQPWSTTLYIWINDKLLFVQVWWGHIASSDLILDVEKENFLYDKLANDGKLSEPCIPGRLEPP